MRTKTNKLWIFGLLILLVFSFASAISYNDFTGFYYPNHVGTTVTDETSEGNDGIAYGGVGFSDNNASTPYMFFDGTDDYVSLGNISGIKTVMLWADLNSTSTAGYLYGNGRDGDDGEGYFGIIKGSATAYSVSYQFHDGTSWRREDTGFNSGLHHFALRFDVPNDKTYFYVDGVLDATINDLPNGFGGTTLESRLGVNTMSTQTSPFAGYLSGVILSTTLLSASDVADVYAEGVDYNPFYALPSVPFKVTTINNYDSSAINSFTVELDGTNSSTTNGTLITSLLQNDTSTHNITIYSNNMFKETNINLNISTDLIGTLDQYPLINVWNKWNSSIQILDFNVTIDSVVYNSDSEGDVYVPYDNIAKSIFYESNAYIDLTITQLLNKNTVYNTTKMFQSIIDFELYTKISNTSITNFSLVNDQGTDITTNGTIIITPNAGVYTDWNFTGLQGDFYSLYNQTINVTSLDEKTITTNSVYDSVLNITLLNAYSNSQVFNFSGWISNDLYGFNETFNTTNGEAIINIEQDLNYTVYVTSPDYSITSDNTKILSNVNTTTSNLSFSLYSSNSVFMNFYDADSGFVITTNLTIIVSGATEENTYHSTTGTLYIENVTDGSYTVKVNGGNYTLGTYTITVADRSSQVLNVYLTLSSELVVFTLLDFNTGGAVEGVSFTMNRLINNAITTVSSKDSDITGKVQFSYTPSVKYYFTSSINGYTDKTFVLDPILFTTYNVKIVPVLNANASYDYAGVTKSYSHNLFYEDVPVNFSITFSSPDGLLSSYNYSLVYPNGNISGTGINAYGDTMTGLVNVTGATYYDVAVLTITYDTVTGSPKTFRTMLEIISNERGENTLIDVDPDDYGLGVLDKVIIAGIIIILFGGVAYFYAGAEVSILITIFLYGLLVKMNFLPLWSILPATLILFVVAIGRKSG